jgi:hypothetical protein
MQRLKFIVNLLCLDDLDGNDDNYGVVQSDEEDGSVQQLKIVDVRVSERQPIKKTLPILGECQQNAEYFQSEGNIRKLCELHCHLEFIKQH